ncbi:hypothetical protein ACED30_13975 [Vibrio splendidus]|uniref:hypothetical protein n=1 Tax=Vibrio splendidus TaxID=29497 RepID=UPI00352EECE0
MINKLEIIVYNLVKNNRGFKNAILFLYQRFFCIFGVLKPKIITTNKYRVFEDCFFGFHDRPSMNRNSLLLAHRQNGKFHKGKGRALIGYFDLKSQDETFKVITETNCCNYQQGSLLTWLSDDTIIYNDSESGKPVTKVVSLDGNVEKKFDFNFYSLSLCRKYLTAISFDDFEKGMPGYGYLEIKPCEFTRKRFSIISFSNSKLEFSFSILEARNYVDFSDYGNEYFSHSLFNFDSSKCYFLYRANNGKRNVSALFCYNLISGKLLHLETSLMVSHLCWLDNNKILAFCSVDSVDGYYIFDTLSGGVRRLESKYLERDGHPTCSQIKGLVLTDCYPSRERRQTLYSIDQNSEEVTVLFDVYSLLKYTDVKRVDFHPRFSQCNKFITIDSPHMKKRCQIVIEI